MRNYEAKNVDEYIKNTPDEAQPISREIRSVIKSAVPNASESISWGVPFYKYHGLLAGFSTFKNHIAFGLAFVLDDKSRQELETMGYATGKKTIQIKFNQKIPKKLITHLLLSRAKENEGKTLLILTYYLDFCILALGQFTGFTKS
ncbi:MAG: DUF1801 domain-containing protein [Patescibacteria group bacterium]|jgi:uncharacterized protein YdhG (YjbR/CyaY superfamily)